VKHKWFTNNDTYVSYHIISYHDTYVYVYIQYKNLLFIFFSTNVKFWKLTKDDSMESFMAYWSCLIPEFRFRSVPAFQLRKGKITLTRALTNAKKFDLNKSLNLSLDLWIFRLVGHHRGLFTSTLIPIHISELPNIVSKLFFWIYCSIVQRGSGIRFHKTFDFDLGYVTLNNRYLNLSCYLRSI